MTFLEPINGALDFSEALFFHKRRVVSVPFFFLWQPRPPSVPFRLPLDGSTPRVPSASHTDLEGLVLSCAHCVWIVKTRQKPFAFPFVNACVVPCGFPFVRVSERFSIRFLGVISYPSNSRPAPRVRCPRVLSFRRDLQPGVLAALVWLSGLHKTQSCTAWLTA